MTRSCSFAALLSSELAARYQRSRRRWAYEFLPFNTRWFPVSCFHVKLLNLWPYISRLKNILQLKRCSAVVCIVPILPSPGSCRHCFGAWLVESDPMPSTFTLTQYSCPQWRYWNVLGTRSFSLSSVMYAVLVCWIKSSNMSRGCPALRHSLSCDRQLLIPEDGAYDSYGLNRERKQSYWLLEEMFVLVSFSWSVHSHLIVISFLLQVNGVL